MPERESDSRRERVRNWLLQEYYIPKYGLPRIGTSDEPANFADFIVFSTGRDNRMNRNLRGVLTEIYGRSFIERYSPGYNITISGIRVDLGGIDLLVTPERERAPIGGFDVTRSIRRIEEKELDHPFPPFERVVLPFIKQGAGAIRDGLQRNGSFNIQDYIDSQAESRRDIVQVTEIARQLDRHININQRVGLISPFKNYLIELRNNLGRHYDIPPNLS